MHAFMRHAYVHSYKHLFMHIFGICAFMQTCIHANMIAHVHTFTSMCAHMRAPVHVVMPAYIVNMHDEKDVMSGVMREREREQA
jgi:hypothetical protein